MPVMDEIFRKANQAGATDVVLGMPHRGRLNLLVGLLKYPSKFSSWYSPSFLSSSPLSPLYKRFLNPYIYAPRHIFYKCQGNPEIAPGVLAIGDVLSHIGMYPTLLAESILIFCFTFLSSLSPLYLFSFYCAGTSVNLEQYGNKPLHVSLIQNPSHLEVSIRNLSSTLFSSFFFISTLTSICDLRLIL